MISAVEIVKAGIAAQNAGQFDKAQELLADDMVFAGPMPQPVGKREFIGLQSALKAAMPDWTLDATDFKEEGDTVTALITLSGKQTNELKLPMPGMPVVPPSGKQVSLPQQKGTWTVKDGKITRLEIAVVPGGGVKGILEQLGASMPG